MICSPKLRSVPGIRSVLAARRSNMKRRRAPIALRPMGEGLEGRELMANLGFDATFGVGGTSKVPNPPDTPGRYISTSLGDVAIQSDGKIIGVGSRLDAPGLSPSQSRNSDKILVARVNPDGSLDRSYGSDGVYIVPWLPRYDSSIIPSFAHAKEVDLALQSDGKLLILADAYVPDGPFYSSSDFVVIRLLPNGGLDSSFGTGGYTFVDFGTSSATSDQDDNPTSIAIGPHGQIVVAGYSRASSVVAQLLPDGTLDPSFGSGGKRTVAFNTGGTYADAVAVQSDGKIILVGSAGVGTLTTADSDYQNYDIAVARLTAQGDPDPSFGMGGLTTIGYDQGDNRLDKGRALVVLPDQIAIAGTSVVPNSSPFGHQNGATLTRVSATGAILSTFSLNLVQKGMAFNTEARTLNLLPDNTLLLGGAADTSEVSNLDYGQYFTNFFADGTINTSYGTGGSSIINDMTFDGDVVVQPDGKLVSTARGGIVRLGSADGIDSVRTTAPAPAVAGDGSAQLVFTSTKKNAKSNTITIKFNTALNPALAGNKSTYRVRIGKKGNRFAAIKRVAYDATSQTVTITLKQKFNRKAVLQVLVAPLGIAGADSQFLNGGQPTTIPVVATA